MHIHTRPSRRPAAPARLLVAALAATLLFASAAAAQPRVFQTAPTTGPVPQVNLATLALAPPFNLEAAADSIQARLAGRTVGYAIAVSYRGNVVATRAGGVARRAPDAPARAMTADEPYNIASVSKTITASALVQLLYRQRRLSLLDSAMHRFLPSGWTFGNKVQQITLRDLLTHRGGLRCPGNVSYAELRQCLAAGIQDTAYHVWQYNNSNYGLLRLIIPRLAEPNALMLNTPDGQAQWAANRYIAYVRQNVLAPAGITDADCKPRGTAPGMAYQYPDGVGSAGTHFGDMTLTCASQGWNLSARQLGKWAGTFLFTESIVPASVSAQMRSEGLGLFTNRISRTLWETGHGGYYPGKTDDGKALWNPGQISTVLVGFSNGVSVAAIVNSQISTGPSAPNMSLDALVKEGLQAAMP
jgi:CubicO group peptidase (beta-lactamase class C family)